MSLISISTEGITLNARLGDSETAKAILKALPIEGTVNTWGDEIYFEIPVSVDLDDDATETVEVGDLGYWNVGRAFCIFFGPTPASTDEKPRAASPVNVFGKCEGDAKQLRNVDGGSPIRIELLGDENS